jgi:hypothetical protein
MHPPVVRRVVLLSKGRLEVLDALRTTTLHSHFWLLLSEHLAESTRRRCNSGAVANTKLAYLQAKLIKMMSLERRVALLRRDHSDPTSSQTTTPYANEMTMSERTEMLAL